MRTKATIWTVFLLSLLAVTPPSALAFTWVLRSGPPSYLPATGHYYQVWEATVAIGEGFGWQDADAFASSLSHLGMPGYVATIATEAEAEMLNGYNELRGGGYVGAVRDGDGNWVWATGPEVGQPVVFRRGTPVYRLTGTHCVPYTDRLFIGGNNWFYAPEYIVKFNGVPSNCLPSTSVIVEFGAPPVSSDRQSWSGLKARF